jgi:hypothetical protein
MTNDIKRYINACWIFGNDNCKFILKHSTLGACVPTQLFVRRSYIY